MPGVSTLHHLACTGGTIVSKALAAMPAAYLVSEVHPYRTAPFQFEPQASLAQFQAQYGALTRERLKRAVLAQVELMAEQAQEDGRVLVLRDHAHSDFNTFQPQPRAALRALLLEANWTVASAVTVRDPMESYLSLRANGWTDGLDFDTYCKRWLQFVAAYRDAPLFIYERFAEAPDEVLPQLCAALGLAFDPSYRSRLGRRMLTGDSGRAESEIAPRPFKPVDTLLAAEAARSPAYERLLQAWPLYRRPLGLGADAPRLATTLAPSARGDALAPAVLRNVLINGDFSIWQRGPSAVIKGRSWSYVADRWRVFQDDPGARCDVSQERETVRTGQEGPPSLSYARFVFSPGDETTHRQIYQPIEGIDPFAGGPVTISAWLRSPEGAQAAAGFWRSFGEGGSEGVSVGNDVFQTITPEWTRLVWTVNSPPLPAKSVVGSDPRLEFTLVILLQRQSTIDVSCVQVEVGTVPTPFERRTPALETVLCRRYYRRSSARLDLDDLAQEMRLRPLQGGAGPFTYDAEFDVV